MSNEIVIFTDLDGTLLDHNDYSYTAAIPCLDFIRSHNIPLIYTSSKTAVEIRELCVQTNIYHPFIAENGGLLAIPKNYFSLNKSIEKNYEHKLVGLSRNDINLILQSLHSRYKFISFHDMSINEIIELTGLDKKNATMANQRECTEPIVWQDSDDQLKVFSKELEQSNLQLLRGGRFHHVMGSHDKAITMSLVLTYFQENKDIKLTTIALGDSPNDHKMLHAADYGILIPNPDAPKQCLDKQKNLIYASTEGPQGWNDALLKLLKELS